MSDPVLRKDEVVVIDVKMRFLSMVVFMVKWVIASIPAMIILALLTLVLLLIFGSLIMSTLGMNKVKLQDIQGERANPWAK